jgi:hypothetical protein
MAGNPTMPMRRVMISNNTARVIGFDDNGSFDETSDPTAEGACVT